MNSLPFLARLIAANILVKQNKALIAENTFLRTENSYYHEQLPEGHRLTFTDSWRKRFARAAANVGWKRLAEIATVAKASTIRGWLRLMRKGKLGIRRAKTGRPRTDAEIEALIVRMAIENPTWGQERIEGKLETMEIHLSPRTIGAILDRHGVKPAPERGTDSTWKSFVSDHLDVLAATDFFTVDVIGLLGKATYDVLFAIHLATRKVEIPGITEHSNERYMIQVAKNATAADTGWLKQIGVRYLIHDGDGKFCESWKKVLRDALIEPLVIPPNSPNCNAFAERMVRTIKRECTRRLWFISYNGLCDVLHEYVREHYNVERPHQGKGNRALTAAAQAKPPPQKPITGFKASQIRRVRRCRGLISHYERIAA